MQKVAHSAQATGFVEHGLDLSVLIEEDDGIPHPANRGVPTVGHSSERERIVWQHAWRRAVRQRNDLGESYLAITSTGGLGTLKRMGVRDGQMWNRWNREEETKSDDRCAGD